MPLEHYQQNFADALLAANPAAPYGLFEDGPVPLELGWRVYRNNVHHALLGALADTFPVLRAVLGEDAFADAALPFLRRHPPHSPTLAGYGRRFPAWLEISGAERKPLADLARLEWLALDSLSAADRDPLPAGRLAALDPDSLDRLQLSLHPSLRLFHSPWPVLNAWREPDAAAHFLAGDIQPQTVLLVRPRHRLLSAELPGRKSLRLINALAKGQSIAEAAKGLSRELVETSLTTLIAQHCVVGATFAEPR